MEIPPPTPGLPPAGTECQPTTPPARPGIDADGAEFARMVGGEGDAAGDGPPPAPDGPKGDPGPRKIDDPFRLLAEHPGDPTVFKKLPPAGPALPQ